MRKAWFAPVLVIAAIMVQLTVVNGLRLPGGGVPDVVLVLVAALAVAQGPLWGAVIGFGAGLCLDIAPPGSLVIGQYALVFCLAGWAAGRLGGGARSSSLRSAAALAVVVVAAETLAAVLGLALEPAQVSSAEIRAVLPATIGYDLLLCPFVLYLVALAGGVLAKGLAAGGVAGQPAGSQRAAQRRRRRHQPRFAHAAGRAGDGRPGGHGHHAGRTAAPTRARLRLAGGVAGSASGLVRHPGSYPAGAGRPGVAGRSSPSLRLAGGRRGDGTIGSSAGRGSSGRRGGTRWQPGRHPGLLAGSGRQFRPQAGLPGGSATRQHGAGPAPAGLARSRTTIRFGARRGDGTLGRVPGSAPLALPGRPLAGLARSRTTIRFGARRGDGTLGRVPGSAPFTLPGRPLAGLARSRTTIRFGARRGDGTLGRVLGSVPFALPGRPRTSRSALTQGGRPRVVPKVAFRSAGRSAPRRPAAVPQFRRRTAGLRRSGTVSGGVLSHGTVAGARRQTAAPRLRLAAGRRGSGPPGGGMLGGSGRSPLGRPRVRIGKQPRFGYGRWPLLSLLTGRPTGGRWLARKRAGSRLSGWLVGKRTGGSE